MVFEVSDIIRDVRVAIDNNDTSLQMPNNLIDIDTLTLEQIIESKVADAARVVESTAPFYLLDSGKAFGDSIGWDGEAGYGSGHIHLPDDFRRMRSMPCSEADMLASKARLKNLWWR